MLAIMIIGIIGWIEAVGTPTRPLFMAVAILGGLLMGLNWAVFFVNYTKDK
jgi:hypothetical protein